MAFSGSSYFAGIGTAFAALALGFAGGAMITNSAVQPPNKLERVNAAKDPPSADARSSQEQASTAKPPSAQDTPPSPVVAATPSPAANPQAALQPAAPATPKTDAPKTDAASNVPEQPATTARNSAPVSKSEDQTPAKSDRTTVGRAADPSRAVDPNKDASRSTDSGRDASRRRADERKPSDDRKFSDRRRRQDQDDRRLDEATNVVRQMRPDGPVDVVVGRDDAPRYGGRPRHFELFEDDDSPRVIQPPPRFGFFGN